MYLAYYKLGYEKLMSLKYHLFVFKSPCVAPWVQTGSIFRLKKWNFKSAP